MCDKRAFILLLGGGGGSWWLQVCDKRAFVLLLKHTNTCCCTDDFSAIFFLPAIKKTYGLMECKIWKCGFLCVCVGFIHFRGGKEEISIALPIIIICFKREKVCSDVFIIKVASNLSNLSNLSTILNCRFSLEE